MAEEIKGTPIMTLPKPAEYYRLTTQLYEAQQSLKRKRTADSKRMQGLEVERLQRQLQQFNQV